MFKKTSIPFIIPILFLLAVFLSPLFYAYAVTPDQTNLRELDGRGFGHISSGHINTITTEAVNTAFDLTNDLNPLTDPRQSNESIGISPRSQTFIASYVSGVTSTRPLPVHYTSKTMFVTVESATHGFTAFPTAEIQIFGSYVPGSNHVNSSTSGWVPLIWTKIGASEIAAIVSASHTITNITETSISTENQAIIDTVTHTVTSTTGTITSSLFTTNAILNDGTVYTPLSEVGSIMDTTGTYVFDVRGLQNVAIFVKDVTYVTTTITKTFSEY